MAERFRRRRMSLEEEEIEEKVWGGWGGGNEVGLGSQASTNQLYNINCDSQLSLRFFWIGYQMENQISQVAYGVWHEPGIQILLNVAESWLNVGHI